MKSVQWKTINTLLLAAMSLSLVTCKIEVGGSNGGINVSISPNPVYALPVSANSCTSQFSGSGTTTTDLTGPVMFYNRIKIDWASSNSVLNVAYVMLKFKSSALQGGEYTCILQGQELLYVFYGSNAGTTGYTSVVIDPSVTTSIDNSNGCSVRCGSINLVSQQQSAFVTGTATVVGVAEDSSGNFVPAQGQASVTFQWDALQ